MKLTISLSLVYWALWNVFSVSVIVLNFKDKIRFGLGLADIFIDAIILLGILIFNIVYFYSSKPNNLLTGKRKVIIASSFVFIIWVFLKMTILRGGESSWNGQITF
ncbi:MAG: hypothetical protein LPK03_01815 [Pontibacter sp.]|nr:hypothetical protein [Pontibacter sp.]